MGGRVGIDRGRPRMRRVVTTHVSFSPCLRDTRWFSRRHVSVLHLGGTSCLLTAVLPGPVPPARTMCGEVERCTCRRREVAPRCASARRGGAAMDKDATEAAEDIAGARETFVDTLYPAPSLLSETHSV